GNNMALILNNEQIEKLKSQNPNIRLEPYKIPDRPLFPYDTAHFKGFSVDNYGPLWIPKKGATLKISQDNIAAYRRVISVYEGNKLEEKAGKIFINGKEASEYTFKYDYYWMMGDNRHNSEDSRYWGFVPETHIVGKPLFIWFSTKYADMKKGIRWNRIFTSANK
ncbi:MAG TPA: S26 family signal peptidase, partial [Saprospiraceae bacterium]|nr:S26 family signal peptidase [Saprospiraceae bacterium]